MEKTREYIDKYLLPIIINSGEKLEGNIFMTHRTTNYTNKFINKIKNIEILSSNKNVKKVLEIGFNSGFSSLLMLFSNPNITLTCLDKARHSYTIPCFNMIKKTFGDRIKLIVGDSTKTIHNIDETFDLIHIDGGHSVRVAKSDIEQSLRLSKRDTIIIMDDYDNIKLKALWDSYVKLHKLTRVKRQDSIHHDIRKVS